MRFRDKVFLVQAREKADHLWNNQNMEKKQEVFASVSTGAIMI